MIDEHDADPTDALLDVWLATHVDALDRELATQLDIETGVRDAQLLRHVHALDASLHDVIDVDAGLRVILGIQDGRPDAGPTPSGASGRGGQVSRPFELNELPLQTRLQLRPLLITDNTLNRLYEDARDSAFFHSLSNDATTLLQLISAHDTTTPVLHGDHSERALNKLCAFGLALSLEVDNFAGKFAVHRLDAAPLSVSFSAALNDRSLPYDVMTELTQLQRTAQTIGDIVELVLNGVRRISQPGLIGNLARDIDTFIARFDKFILVIGRLHDESIQSFYNTASRLACLAAESAVDIVVRHILKIMEDAICHADVNGVHSVGEKLVYLLSDFTSDDLTDVELDGLELRGVRWSLNTTRWPKGWREPMREASEPLTPDRNPDLYEVRNDPRVRDVVC